MNTDGAGGGRHDTDATHDTLASYDMLQDAASEKDVFRTKVTTAYPRSRCLATMEQCGSLTFVPIESCQESRVKPNMENWKNTRLWRAATLEKSELTQLRSRYIARRIHVMVCLPNIKGLVFSSTTKVQ